MLAALILDTVGEDSPVQLARRLVLELLERPDVSGRDARNLLERRRAEAIRIAGSNPA